MTIYDYIGETRDKGILAPERCRALTEYLRVTNNGEINPFSSQVSNNLPNKKLKREVIYTTNHTNHQYHHYHHTTHSQKGAKTMKNKFITERKGEYLIDGNILQNRKL